MLAHSVIRSDGERAGSRHRYPWALVAIGDASYSLYLLHTFLLDASGRWRFHLNIQSPRLLLAFLVALPIVIVLLSLLWYRWVERPLLKLLS